jgi:hypothetical protein
MKKVWMAMALVMMLAGGGLLGQADSFPGRGKASHRGKSTGLVAYPLLAQNEPAGASNQAPSLGELARKLKEERKAQGTKAVRVFTNENIPRHGGISVMGAGTETAKAKAAEAGAAAPSPKAGRKHGKGYFQKRAQRIRSNLSLHQRELVVLQQQLAQAQMTYYPNPQTTLEQESGPGFQSDANKLRQQIQDKQAQIAGDEKDLQDLQQQLQRDGGDPGWLR